MALAKTIAIVAHTGKTLGGGLPALRAALARAGCQAPLWYEVKGSRRAPKVVRRAVKAGAELIFVWGGDGMVQRSIDALADAPAVALAILPAGTANLLATNLGIPRDLEAAVQIGLHGARRRFDVGVLNGERFAVMAGTGFDAVLMRSVGGRQKERLGRVAYLRTGLKAVQGRSVRMTVRVDGHVWFKGQATTLLAGNVGTLLGGLTVFPAASPSDGVLEVGVVTARGTWQWLRVLSRVARGHLERSPYIAVTHGKKIAIELGRKLPYELDGGDRKPTKKLKIRVVAGAVTLCVPAPPQRRRPMTSVST